METFHKAVLSFSSDPELTNSQLDEIHVINDREGITHKIKTVFFNYFEHVEATTDDPAPGNLNAKSAYQRSREPVNKDSDTRYGAGER